MNGTEKKNYQLVKVYIRQRPFNKNEIESKCTNIVQRLTSREICIKSGFTEKKYNFDQIFGEEVSQLEVYNAVVSPLINYIISGYNCTVFAYGQTGTGKTHTIIGDNTINMNTDIPNDPSVGIIPRAATQLFSELSKLNPKIEYTVRISFIEIYNEEVRDLLNECTPLRVYDDPENKGSVCIKGLTEVTVCNTKEVYEMLHIGTLERQTAATNLNTRSSRSHTLFTLLVNTREITSGGEELIKTGKLHLVDLAGSENIGRSGATDVRAREAGTINKSLLTLGKVIKALAQKLQHIPYRDSKLTRILQDSLGGNTKTCMIGTISPGINAWDETVSTLDYANVARNVANCPQVNVNRKQANFLKELQDEISKLRHELLAARNGEGFYVSVETYEKMAQDIEKNQERILELIRQIRDLEEYKLTREHQYHELNESFKQTKLYLETTGKELEKKKNKVKQNEFILSYMRERDEELSEKANVLLKVCETSTKHEEIYHSKYEGQCNATLSNANLANSILSSSVNYLKEVQNVSNIHLNDQEMYRSEVKRSLQSLEENHTRDLEQIAQLSSEMQEQTDNHEGLCFEKIFKNDTTEYSENNIKNYFNSVYDNNLVQLTNHSKFKNSLEMLKDHTLTKTAEMKLKSTHCLNSINSGLVEKENYFTTTKVILEKMHKDLCERYNHIQNQKSRNKTLKLIIEEHLSIIEKEDNELEMESLSLKQVIEDMLESVRKCENEKLSSNIKESLADYMDCQTETVKTQISMIDNVINDVDENEVNSRNQAASDRASMNQYLSGLVKTVKGNLNQYNVEFKNVVHDWVKKASAIKENLFKTATQSSTTIDKNVDLMSSCTSNYNADMKRFVQQSLEDLQDLEKNIISTTHVGDTPVKNTYKYPKRIEKRISNHTLLERFKNIPEELLEPVPDIEDAV